MAHARGKYADFEGLRERAVALRRGGAAATASGRSATS